MDPNLNPPLVSDAEDDDMLYSTTQLQILQWTSVVTGALSLAGSGWIIYQILTTRPPRAYRSLGTTQRCLSTAALEKSMYLRLMLGFSFLDALSSLGHVGFSSWSIPAEVTSGNWALCQAGAFLVHQMLGTTLYSAYLALFFVLSIRYEVREVWMAKWLEPWMHASAILVPMITGGIAVAKDYFSPLHMIPGTSWFDAYPPGCEDVDINSCIRVTSSFMALVCAAFPIVLSVLVSTVCMVLLVQKVRQTELLMRQYQQQPQQLDHPEDPPQSTTATTTTTRPSPPREAVARSLASTKRVTIQALLYIGVFFVTYLALFVVQILIQAVNLPETSEYRHVWFPWSLLVKIFVPLQGALNAFVFWYRRVDSAQELGALNEYACWYRRVEGDSAAAAAPEKHFKLTRATSTTTAMSSRESVLAVVSSVREATLAKTDQYGHLRLDPSKDQDLKISGQQQQRGDYDV